MQCVKATSKHDKLTIDNPFSKLNECISLNFRRVKQIILILEIYFAFGLVHIKWHSFINGTPLVWSGSVSNSQPTNVKVDVLPFELRLQPKFSLWSFSHLDV